MRSIGQGGTPTHRIARPILRSAAVVALLASFGRGEPLRADPADAPGATEVVVHPDAPLDPSHNVLWCVTSQLAWDALADALVAAKLSGPSPRFGPPSSAEEIEWLNRRSYQASIVDPAALAVVGGRAEDGVLARAAEVWRSRFGAEAKPPFDAVGPGDVIGAAALAKALPFERPFTVHPRPIRFARGEAVVRAWGIKPSESGPEAAKIAEQVRVYVPPKLKFGTKPPALIAEFTPRDPQERIVLARLPPAATLAATWAAVDELLRTWVSDTVDPGSNLVVPTIRLDLRHRFSSLEGGALEGAAGSRLGRFQSRVKFELTERGASVAAESVVICTLGLHPQLVFDRPFLVALRRVGAPQPYLLLWVGNDALLERWTPPVTQAPDPKTLAELVGRWTIDPDATGDASSLRKRERGVIRWTELGFADGATPSDAEFLAAMRRRNAMALISGTLVVAAGGNAELEMLEDSRDRGRSDPEPEQVRQALTLLRRDGTHWFTLRLRPDSTKEVHPEDGYRVQWNGTDLRLVSGVGVIVFRRAP